MIAFLLLGAGALVVVALAIVAYSANQRRRAGQSGPDAVEKQRKDPEPRASGLD